MADTVSLPPEFILVPLVTDPLMSGVELTLHVTRVLFVPATAEANWSELPACTDGFKGLIETAITG